jgi:hypothetical protein
MTDLKRTEPDITWDEAMGLAATNRDQLLARLKRGNKVLDASLWPTKAQPRRVRFLRWQWRVVDEQSGAVLNEGYALSQPLAWTRTDRAAKRIRDERAAKRAES